MKVQDLRVGNLLTYNNKYFKVLEIYQEKIKSQSNKGIVEFNLSELKPIPLTEEILIELGFKKKGDFFFDWYLAIEHFRYGVYIITYDENPKFVSRVGRHGFKHVHQLQNLYYSLTNKELKINL